jgi:uncharacterized membrane protein
MNDENAKPASSTAESPSGAICYLFGILFPLTYLLGTRRDRQKRFLRFHCIQCLVLFLLWTPLLFAHRTALTSSVGSLLFVGWLVALIQAKRRKLFHLPLIGWLAERLT